ncbi:hypothetical protein CVS30_16400 [Arthrobacter psychrolactophilus]|uniref:Uncharacterized protein n=1 Tax=Arthrobacter psychrolactophilus TaxID=92442 RepID=A0A2V5JJE2_9MICC|nr:hypothetical protein [Arthrobacter psychrolactophilus]PYI37296.1 hypothetical protein CVS30_16400 [Arthrobacter psychrolactophilus]
MTERPAKLHSLKPSVLGDSLVIAINSDDSILRLKGSGGPLNSVRRHLSLPAALSCVDYATLVGDETAVELVRGIKPERHATGGDYCPEVLDVAGEVTARGKRVEILGGVPDHFTAALVEQ